MSGKVRPSFMSRININFNNLLPQVWYQAIIFWKLISTYNVYIFMLYICLYSNFFVSPFFGAFLIIEKLNIICKEKNNIFTQTVLFYKPVGGMP